MRRWLLPLLAVAALAFPLPALGMGASEYPVVSPVVSAVSGEVSVRQAAADWAKATVGLLLASGDSVRTGPDGRCELSAATGKIRLYENSLLVLPEVADEGDRKDLRRVQLEDGTGLFRIRKRGVERGFEVRTPHLVAGVKGTLFAVQASREKGYSRVAVYSGVVEVTDLNRIPETLVIMRRGELTQLLQDLTGAGRVERFDPGSDIWRGWQEGPRLDLTPPSEAAPLGMRIEGSPPVEGAGRPGGARYCPPVTDDEGNPIYY